MSRDVTIRLPDSGTPAEYEVPNATEIVVKSVTALFDGSGAAGTFAPTVEIVSDGGVVVARVPCQTSVAAGDSAEVTFAPFLRADAQAAVAAGTAQWLSVGKWYGNFAPLTIPSYPDAGYIVEVDWTGGDWRTSAGSGFSWDAAFPQTVNFRSGSDGWVMHCQGFASVNTELAAGLDPNEFTVLPYVSGTMDHPNSVDFGSQQGFRARWGGSGSAGHISSTEWGAITLNAVDGNTDITAVLQLINEYRSAIGDELAITETEMRIIAWPTSTSSTRVNPLA